MEAADIENTKATKTYEMVKTHDMTTLDDGTSSRLSPDIVWSDLNFVAGKANILTNCWGKVGSNKVCAIMGPSGAGKSSLLNVLAGRSASAADISVSGKISVGGKLINPVAFRKNIAYVMQDDALLATATPREALRFSANMRLPSTLLESEIDLMVSTCLEDLGLTVCADVMIGGALIKGISGGQRKRTSVGVELITNPTLLFLDEPTSGLDSYTAYSLIKLLKKVAVKDNTTILCTIHQPSSEVFFLFDTVLFMKSGRMFYQGPVDEIVHHFHKFGYDCPHNYNPSDFIMNLCQVLTVQDIEAKGMFIDCPAELVDNRETIKLDADVEFITQSSFMRQLHYLCYREVVNTYRDVGALIGRFGVTCFLFILFGIIFWNAGGKDYGDSTNFNSHFGAIAMTLIAGMFGAAQPTMLSFPFERPMFLREYSTGTYGVLPYFLSKLSTEVVLCFAQNLIQYLLMYFMADFQGNFIYLVLATFGLSMAASSVALCLGCSVNNVKDATELSPLLFVPQMLFIGFFIRTSLIPIFLRWAQYLCSLKYAMNLVILTEFNPSSGPCNTSDAAHQNCQNMIDTNNIVEGDYYIYIIILFALFLAFRIVAGMILTQKAKRFY